MDLRKLFFCLLTLFATGNISGQIFNTRAGTIRFYSKTPLEDIDAENKQTYAVVDVSKKELAFSVLLKGFLFKKELMQEHFNENYVESDKFPKANFIGTYAGDLTEGKSGVVEVNGKLTLHGITKNITITATLGYDDQHLTGTSAFKLIPEDFNIKIPGLVREKIAKQIDVQVQIDCKRIK